MSTYNEQLQSRTPGKKPQWGCLGCFGSLAMTVLAGMIAYVLIAPWTFHMGGRWTPLARWDGVGRLRDSAGTEYGLYVRIAPSMDIDFRTDGYTPCCNVSGKARVCTASGDTYDFTVAGSASGAWLHTDGSKMTITLAEAGHPKLPRIFTLAGVWRGPALVLDDEKSMYMHFLPGGHLTPAPAYSSPVPEKHAHATLAWGTLDDFQQICNGVGAARRHSRR